MNVTSVTAEVREGDPGPEGVNPDVAVVTLTLADGAEVTVTVHQSRVYANTINIEIDGDFDNSNPCARINMNDLLIYDTEVDGDEYIPPEEDRKPDLPDTDDE